MSSEPPPGFLQLLSPLLRALARDVGVAPASVELFPSLLRASLEGETLAVPDAYVRHWRRFGNLPSALVRDVAYALKKRSLQSSSIGGSIEADAMAYAERFIRMVSEGTAAE